MENQVLAIALNKVRNNCKAEIFKLENKVGEISEVLIFINTDLHTDKKYPKSLADIPTRIITLNNLEDELKFSLKNSKVIFLLEFLDSFLINILRKIPSIEGYYLTPDHLKLNKVKKEYHYFDLLEKLLTEIIDDGTKNSVTNISFKEEEWIINNEVGTILSEHFLITNVIALKHQDDFIFDAFISQLERKDDKSLKYQMAIDESGKFVNNFKRLVKDLKSVKTAFVIKDFESHTVQHKSYVEKIIARNKQPEQKYIFDIKSEDDVFSILEPKYVKLPTVRLLVRKFNRFEVFKFLLFKISRDLQKDILLIHPSISSVEIIIKNLKLFHFDLSIPYKIILRLIKEQKSPQVDLSSVSFWYEIYFHLNELFSSQGADYKEKIIKVVQQTDDQNNRHFTREDKVKYLSQLPNQLSIKLIVLPKKGTDDVKKKWLTKYNGKLIRDDDYSLRFIHIIKELYDCYLERRVIDVEDLSREVDTKLGTVRKSEEQEKVLDKRGNVFNKLRGSKREFLAPFSDYYIDLRKHFVISKDGCSFDPKEELGITFLYPNKD